MNKITRDAILESRDKANNYSLSDTKEYNKEKNIF